jgi:hypothetical protein
MTDVAIPYAINTRFHRDFPRGGNRVRTTTTPASNLRSPRMELGFAE